MKPHFRPRMRACVALSVVTLLSAQSLSAEDLEGQLENAPPITKVEEDWEVVVADPDTSLDLPQIVTVFGPTNANFGTHTVFELNHGTLPSFTAGGMQIQVWWGDALIGYKQQHAPVQLNLQNETLRYTTVTELTGGVLKMRVINGTSETWGTFGGGSLMLVELTSDRNDLNPYDPGNSIAHSRVTFGANRVNHFMRKAIRFYTSNGNVYAESTTPAYVHKLANED